MKVTVSRTTEKFNKVKTPHEKVCFLSTISVYQISNSKRTKTQTGVGDSKEH